MIADFIIENRGQGHYLPYTDYSLIEGWIKAAKNIDDLLLILAEELPRYFEKQSGQIPKSISGINKKILKKLVVQNKRSIDM